MSFTIPEGNLHAPFTSYPRELLRLKEELEAAAGNAEDTAERRRLEQAVREAKRRAGTAQRHLLKESGLRVVTPDSGDNLAARLYLGEANDNDLICTLHYLAGATRYADPSPIFRYDAGEGLGFCTACNSRAVNPMDVCDVCGEDHGVDHG